MDVNTAVLDRYSEGARERQADLCCPVDYDTGLLKALPREIIDRDYGCGDPSRYVHPGDTVLDLGSGGGKICYMAAQIVGQGGRVIGVDMNDDMLELARSYQTQMQEQFGTRIDFVKGQIQDLKLDVEALEARLKQQPIQSAQDLLDFEAWKTDVAAQTPLIADESITLVLSNCVLNLVSDEQKQQLVDEIWRVTKPGGRIAISDIVADQDIPQDMKDDPELWSGCISGAFGEQEFLDAFAIVGFSNVYYDKWDVQPWKVINGIEFRSVTLVATKPEETEAGKVMYRGPHQTIMTDDGDVYERGERYTVDGMTKASLLASGDFIDLAAEPAISEPAEAGACCSPDSGCC